MSNNNDEFRKTPDFKQLLTDLEGGGGRTAASFSTICKHNQSFYGEPGSERRRFLQFKVRDLRSNRKTNPKAYLQILKDLRVVPCDNTLIEALNYDDTGTIQSSPSKSGAKLKKKSKSDESVLSFESFQPPESVSFRSATTATMGKKQIDSDDDSSTQSMSVDLSRRLSGLNLTPQRGTSNKRSKSSSIRGRRQQQQQVVHETNNHVLFVDPSRPEATWPFYIKLVRVRGICSVRGIYDDLTLLSRLRTSNTTTRHTRFGRLNAAHMHLTSTPGKLL